MKYFVYKIINKELNKYYVGSTCHLKERANRHFSELRTNKHHNFDLQNDYNEYGTDSFYSETVAEFNTEKEARDLEQKIIDENYDSIYNVGKNARFGGDLMSYHPKHDEITNKISNTLKNKMSKMTEEERAFKFGHSGELNPMYGKTHTEEARRKMSEANIGRIPYNKGLSNEESLGKEKAKQISQKLSKYAQKRTGDKNSFYGKHHSEETKEKIRQANKGRIPTNRYAVNINGVEYPALTIAAKELGMNASTLLNRIRSKNYPTYKKV